MCNWMNGEEIGGREFIGISSKRIICRISGGRLVIEGIVMRKFMFQ